MNGSDLTSGQAWRDFCARLSDLGDKIFDPGKDYSEADRAEGYRHLLNQVACWSTYAVGSSDPAQPLLFRHNDLVYRWGGPNVDQNARRTTISGQHTYRLSGSMGACEEFAVQAKRGEMHNKGGGGVDVTLWASDLGIGPGDAFDILISSDPADNPTLLMSPDSSLLHVRDYYYDWQSAEPATFVIERIDRVDTPGRPTPDRIAGMLDNALVQIENSMLYWPPYQDARRAEAPLNEFSTPGLVAEGVGDLFYSHCFVRIEPDEALVVTVRPDDAAHWNLQLYMREWYEPLDHVNRITNLNEAMAARDADGSVRIVISARDPGVANWLDTEGRVEVMATSRWTKPEGMPAITTQRVKLSDLDALGLGPTIDAEARHQQIEARRSHLAWRCHC
ncbi:DUF1214 domain-containing protein [Sphingomonas montanisoli]|uniref:DUF1214 domain-containing protein n=1 Tax=Sphingomonas montanisoli TaxID=2606412 RepID=A0A5D9CCB3_9SPHN|nr:DUF1214 domain-containing protein [Sphingomonas montanisoli]TZG27725.1 DUF1214 domain-containing protein [Sphingomonas montanisoli]